jgi:hypothetical protein
MPRNFTIQDILNSPAGKINQHLQNAPNNPQIRKSKYRAQKVDADGLTFDSKKEYNRYKELKLLLKAGEIGFLACQVEYTFNISGAKVASYIADFQYTDTKTGELIVEDVKSDVTRKLPVYRLKRKLMQQVHNIKIKEV